MDASPRFLHENVMINKIPTERFKSHIVEPIPNLIKNLMEYFKLAREFTDNETGRSLVSFGEKYFWCHV